MTHQSLPAFSQPFGGARSFRGYSSPPYASQQASAGSGASSGDPSTWSYPVSAADSLTTQYGSVATPSRRQTSNPVPMSAAASLSASESPLFINTTIIIIKNFYLAAKQLTTLQIKYSALALNYY